MAKIFTQQDANLELLKDKLIAVIGYGNQGRNQALNLRDSGLDLVIGLRSGPSWEAASRDGFDVLPMDQACARSQMILLLIPDQYHKQVYEKYIKHHLSQGKILGVSHAFSVYYGLVVPPPDVDVVLMAPKSPGEMLRRRFLEGSGVPACVGVYQDHSGRALDYALAWGAGVGAGRAGMILTDFREEVETDHFGEIAVLCGGVAELIKSGFQILVDAGYQPEVAYFECLNELKLIVDLIQRGGLEYMWRCVSDTAEYGGRKYGPQIIDQGVRENMRRLLEYIRSGEYARELIQQQSQGMPQLRELRESQADLLIEKIGSKLRPLINR